MQQNTNSATNVSISKQWEENIRAEELSKLETRDGSKAMTGPFFSDGIVYHYHDTDSKGVTRMHRIRLHHFYWTNKTYDRDLASSYTMAFDQYIFDRDAQITARKAINAYVEGETATLAENHWDVITTKADLLEEPVEQVLETKAAELEELLEDKLQRQWNEDFSDDNGNKAVLDAFAKTDMANVLGDDFKQTLWAYSILKVYDYNVTEVETDFLPKFVKIGRAHV